MLFLHAVALAAQTCLYASSTVLAKLSFLGAAAAPYQPLVLLLLVELTKLVTMCGCVARQRRARGGMVVTTLASAPHARNRVWWYAVPACLYATANASVFLVVGTITPGEIQLIWNVRLLFTALLFRWFLKRPVSMIQWASLTTLLAGVLVVEYSFTGDSGESAPPPAYSNHTAGGIVSDGTGVDKASPRTAVTSFHRSLAVGCIVVGALVASFASVTTEYLFKRSRESLWEQNAKLYACSLPLLLLTIPLRPVGSTAVAGSGGAWSLDSMFVGWNWFCTVSLFVRSFHGVFTGFVLKFFDVILVAHAEASATMLNVILSAIFFDLEASPVFLVGALIIVCSILVYHHAASRNDAAVRENAERKADRAARRLVPLEEEGGEEEGTITEVIDEDKLVGCHGNFSGTDSFDAM